MAVGFSCMRCTRVFEVDARPPADRLPRHLDALLGVPCEGGGEPVLLYT